MYEYDTCTCEFRCDEKNAPVPPFPRKIFYGVNKVDFLAKRSIYFLLDITRWSAVNRESSHADKVFFSRFNMVRYTPRSILSVAFVNRFYISRKDFPLKRIFVETSLWNIISNFHRHRSMLDIYLLFRFLSLTLTKWLNDEVRFDRF